MRIYNTANEMDDDVNVNLPQLEVRAARCSPFFTANSSLPAAARSLHLLMNASPASQLPYTLSIMLFGYL